jgi:hypothetical protein
MICTLSPIRRPPIVALGGISLVADLWKLPRSLQYPWKNGWGATYAARAFAASAAVHYGLLFSEVEWQQVADVVVSSARRQLGEELEQIKKRLDTAGATG